MPSGFSTSPKRRKYERRAARNGGRRCDGPGPLCLPENKLEIEFDGVRGYYKMKKARRGTKRVVETELRGAGGVGKGRKANPVCGTADAAMAAQKGRNREDRISGK